jgi:hypothetical protein
VLGQGAGECLKVETSRSSMTFAKVSKGLGGLSPQARKPLRSSVDTQEQGQECDERPRLVDDEEGEPEAEAGLGCCGRGPVDRRLPSERPERLPALERDYGAHEEVVDGGLRDHRQQAERNEVGQQAQGRAR